MDSLVTKLHQPCDPSLLAFFRICFGFFMMLDIPQERGMAYADVYYGDMKSYCTFPLVHGMKPFNPDEMVVLYAILFINAFCITTGFFYHLNALSFTCIYWYIFLLDTSTWNNHSYLYGLLAILLLVTNANSFFSIDGLINKEIFNSEVPRWNYAVFRFQVFIVYFYAGLKKTEEDWLLGYSMHRLSRQWVFDPLRLFLSDENIDFWIIHICGFVYDTIVGFLLYFDRTRVMGLLLCGMFHGLNSRMFNIGMFPYVMFTASFIFCYPGSFKDFLSKLPLVGKCFETGKANPSSSCVYTRFIKENKKSNKSWKHNIAALFFILYISMQAILPYSHFVTKGYNGWTQGLYGYSWDMMVHSFKNQHIKITYKNLDTGETGFLKPDAFLSGKKSRWATQPAMAIQYARCISRQLATFGIKNSAVYFDIWKSMNGRFQQRIFDPHIDLAHYPWSPFQSPTFVMPLLSDLSHWREKLVEIKRNLRNITEEYDVVFVANFPGLYLENFVHKDLGNTTLEVLNGKVLVETAHGTNVSLKTSEKYQITPGEFHKVHTVSSTPSCYAYIYINTTAQEIRSKVSQYERQLKAETLEHNGEDLLESSDQTIAELYWREQRYKEFRQNRTFWESCQKFWLKKFILFRRSFLSAFFASRHVCLGKPPEEKLSEETNFLNSWNFPTREPPETLETSSEITSPQDRKTEL